MDPIRHQAGIEKAKEIREAIMKDTATRDKMESKSCLVCTNQFQIGEETIELPCHQDHFFHVPCFEQWRDEATSEEHATKKGNACAVCRAVEAQLLEQPAMVELEQRYTNPNKWPTHYSAKYSKHLLLEEFLIIYFKRGGLNTMKMYKDIMMGFTKALNDSNYELDSDEEALRGKTIRTDDDGDTFMIGIYAHGEVCAVEKEDSFDFAKKKLH